MQDKWNTAELSVIGAAIAVATSLAWFGALRAKELKHDAAIAAERASYDAKVDTAVQLTARSKPAITTTGSVLVVLSFDDLQKMGALRRVQK